MCNAHGDSGCSYGAPASYGTSKVSYTPIKRVEIMTQSLMKFKTYTESLGGYKL